MRLDRSGNILDWLDVCWTCSGLTVGFLGSWTGRGQARPVQDKLEGPGMKLDRLGKAESIQDTSVDFLEKKVGLVKGKDRFSILIFKSVSSY